MGKAKPLRGGAGGGGQRGNFARTSESDHPPFYRISQTRDGSPEPQVRRFPLIFCIRLSILLSEMTETTNQVGYPCIVIDNFGDLAVAYGDD